MPKPTFDEFTLGAIPRLKRLPTQSTLFAAAAIALIAAPGIALALTIEQAAQAAVLRDPRPASADANARSVAFDIDVAKAAFAPKVAVTADPGRAYDSFSKSTQSAFDPALRGSYLLYDGGRSQAEVERQSARLDGARLRGRATLDQSILQTVSAYLDVLRQSRFVTLARVNVDAHQQLYDQVAQIVAIDRGRRSDLEQVDARLQQAKATLAVRIGAYDEARALLGQLVGEAVQAVEMPRDPGSALPTDEADLKAAIDVLPAVKAAKADVEAAQAAARGSAAWNKPRIDLSAGVGTATDIFGERKRLGAADARFVLNWTGYDGGAGRATAAGTALAATAAQYQVEAAKRDAQIDIARLYSSLPTRRSRIDEFETLARQIGIVKGGYWAQFKVGRRAILDLLNVESELFQAMVGAESERVDLLEYEYRVLASLSRLADWLGVTMPVEGAVPAPLPGVLMGTAPRRAAGTAPAPVQEGERPKLVNPRSLTISEISMPPSRPDGDGSKQ